MLDNHPQWDIPDTEEEDEEQEDSDGIEESEDDDEDNDWMLTYTHTHTRTHSQLPVPPNWSGHPPTPEPTAAPKSLNLGAATRCLPHTQNHRGQFVHMEPSSTSISSFTITWTVTPAPLLPLFYKDLFIHFPSPAEGKSVNTYTGPCVNGCICESVCVYAVCL